jgi:hypothetical protein
MGETSVPSCMRVLMPVCLLVGISAALAQNPNDRPPSEPDQSPYSVAGLTLGARVKFTSLEYQEYRCSPSGQFEGFTSCRKIRQERSARGAFNAMYSFLHARDGTVVYIDRYQEPAFLGAKDAEEEIQRYSGKLGESPRTTTVPGRPGLPAGILASWGKIVLEPLDHESRKALEEGRVPGTGYLIDFIGDFTRSAKEALPIYRIGGGAGFVLAASFDQRDRGTLRLTAADASHFQPDRDRTPRQP